MRGLVSAGEAGLFLYRSASPAYRQAGAWRPVSGESRGPAAFFALRPQRARGTKVFPGESGLGAGFPFFFGTVRHEGDWQ